MQGPRHVHDPESRQSPSERARLAVVGTLAAAVLVAAPLVGSPPLVRLPAVLVPAFALATFILRPWRWPQSRVDALRRWQPSARFVACSLCAIGLVLYWFVLTRFRSGDINAIDFTVYFDRPLFQTWHGRPLFVETADHGYGNRSELAVHAYWAMLPLAALYAIRATPQWLLALSIVSVVMGARHMLRVMQRIGAGGVLACTTALAYVLNDNTARTLNYGFHPEVLYAWFVPWLLDAGLAGHRASFVIAILACVSVKEDACMPLFAASVALALHRGRRMTGRDRFLFLVMPTLIGVLNLALYYRFVVPRFMLDGIPTYANFWANYGPTPYAALGAMLHRPWRVLGQAATSGFFSLVLAPHLWLPLVGWRYTIGVAPIVALYGASANDQLREFGLYYAMVLVPFLTAGASVGALRLANLRIGDPDRAQWIASGVVLAGALVVGSWYSGYVLRPWKAEVRAVPTAMSELDREPVLLVQSGLYPHAGYEDRVKLLTPETLETAQRNGAALLLAPRMSGYPFSPADIDRLAQQPSVRPLPDGLVAVRIRGASPPSTAR